MIVILNYIDTLSIISLQNLKSNYKTPKKQEVEKVSIVL